MATLLGRVAGLGRLSPITWNREVKHQVEPDNRVERRNIREPSPPHPGYCFLALTFMNSGSRDQRRKRLSEAGIGSRMTSIANPASLRARA
jgi:hypothetical protein